MSDKKNTGKMVVNMDFGQLYPNIMNSFNITPEGFRKIFRMISIKKIFKD